LEERYNAVHHQYPCILHKPDQMDALLYLISNKLSKTCPKSRNMITKQTNKYIKKRRSIIDDDDDGY
jgi:hypothetical protein